MFTNTIEQTSCHHNVFIKYYSKLTSILKIKHLVDHFISERIIGVEEKESITLDSLLFTIESHLKSGINRTFCKMLDIMVKFGDLATEELAKNIKKELTTIVSPIPKVVDFNTFDEVEIMFTAFVSALRNMLSEDKFKMIRLGCITNNKTLRTRLPDDFINKIDATETLDDLFDVVVKSPYCNWMNIRLLEKMAAASLQSNARQLVNQYKEAVSSKKLKDIFQHIPEVLSQITDNFYSKIKQRWKKNFDDVTVKDIIGQWCRLEKIFDVDEPTLLLDRVIEGSVEFHWLIPSELVRHAQYSAFRNWRQLDDMLYLDIHDNVIKTQFDFDIVDSSTGT